MGSDRSSSGGTLTSVAFPAGPVNVHAPWREAAGVRQDAPGFHKRWFSHPSADLFAWLDADGTLSSLQFCWRVDDVEHMVAWDRDREAEVGRVDAGESSPLHNRSPVLVRDDRPRDDRRAWEERRAGLPPEVISAVQRALRWE